MSKKIIALQSWVWVAMMLPTATLANQQSLSLEAQTPAGFAMAHGVGHEDQAGLPLARLGGNDSDNDGLPDFADNCATVANANQYDSNGDGYGNACDPDLDNNGLVNFLDLQLMQSAFFSNPASPNWNPDADLTGDNFINFPDLIIMQQSFFSTPGPSGMSCAGSVPCPQAQLVLDWPMPGTDANEWVINNYVDLNGGPAVVDYQGGGKSYNGHRGVDIDVPTFRAMDEDFPILASAQGTVLGIEDDNYDRNTSCVGAWNFVTVGHPNGWKTIYGHLKKDSVVVSVGQVVEAGDVLGVVGSSGCSTAPHLHLETHDENGAFRSPFAEGMWSNPPVYSTPIGLMDAAIYNGAVTTVGMIKDPPPNATIVPPGGVIGTGLSIGGGSAGDVINFRIINAFGAQIATFNASVTATYRHTFWWYNYGFSAGASGQHQMQIRLNGNLVRTHDFTVAPILNGFQQVRHGVPAANYQALFNDLVANGYRPVWVDGYDVNGATFFNVIFDQTVVASWSAAHHQDNAQYQAYFDAQVAAGRRLVHIDSYLLGGQLRHTSIFADQPTTAWAAYHGLTVAQHQAQFNALVAQGFRASIISSVQAGGTQVFSALYDKRPVGSWVALANLSNAQYQSAFNDQVNAGRTLAYLNAYTLNGVPVFSAIFNSVVPTSWVARHHLTATQFQSDFDNYVGNFGLHTRVITGYQNGGVANFGGLWTN